MRRLTLVTTRYGRDLLTYAQLKQLQSEVARAASLARWSDPDYLGLQRTGRHASEAKGAR